MRNGESLAGEEIKHRAKTESNFKMVDSVYNNSGRKAMIHSTVVQQNQDSTRRDVRVKIQKLLKHRVLSQTLIQENILFIYK